MHCPNCATELVDDARNCASCGAAVPQPTAQLAVPAGVRTPPKPVAAGADEARFVPGTVLAGRFRVVALLGRGGMGEVYRAEDLRLGQPVALKFLPEALSPDAQALQRFYSEVRLGRGVAHPNVCRMYDLVEFEGHRCLSMEYVDGEDLATLLRRIGRLPTDKAIDIAREVCAGLAAAHEAGVIHRDLKPANIMVDGRGKARLTDFGIATPSSATAIAELAGTPAYMAPELLRGEPASVQSDLYALGLVLFELCSGRPAAEVRDWALRGGHASGTLESLRELPVELRSPIEHCVAADPTARPGSARALLALLPGGDPLAAALAAGETPSPEMVAAAGRAGDLSLARAWTLLLATIAGLALLAMLAPSQTIVGMLGVDKPPEVLTERARGMLAELSGAPAPEDWWGGHRWDHDVEPWWNAQPPAHFHARPDPVAFHYRQAPFPLAATKSARVSLLPAPVGMLTLDDPPLATPGVASITLDRIGRMTRLYAPSSTGGANASAPDDALWSAAFAAAGLDPKDFAPTEPTALAPMEAGSRRAWDGHFPGQDQPRVRVEAASSAGRLVWFEVQGPWTSTDPTPAMTTALDQLGLWTALVFCIALAGPLLFLLRKHLRQGRGDRAGALRLALATAAIVGLSLLLRADHVPRIAEEYALVVNILSQLSYFAISMWVTYIAVEPFARRRSPHLMIGWSRLLAGRLHDPLVGCELLVGAAVAVGLSLLLAASVALPREWTGSNGLPNWQAMSALGSLRHSAYYLLANTHLALLLALGSLFAYQLLATATGRRWIALPLQFAFCHVFFAATVSGAGTLVPFLFAGAWMLVLLRVGVLAAVACQVVNALLIAMPPLLFVDSWHQPTTVLLYLGLLAALAWAFRVSLGGKPMFGASIG